LSPIATQDRIRRRNDRRGDANGTGSSVERIAAAVVERAGAA